MTRVADSARRIATAARLLLMDLSRRRVSLVLLLVVPALFQAVVLVTTASRPVDVTLAALVQDDSLIRTPESTPDPFDTALDDDGSRRVDERQLSLVFLGTAAVGFLACFFAFTLVHKRREVDARLVLAGYRAYEVLLAKGIVLLLLGALLSLYETAMLMPWVVPRRAFLLASGLFSCAFTYGCLGLIVGALAKHELEGIFGIVLLTNVDVGWLQNPIYFAHSARRALIRALPGYGPVQLATVGAFTDDGPRGVLTRACAWVLVALATALLVFGLRIRPPRQDRSERSRMRWRYAKVLAMIYVGWFGAFEIVGRYAATLPTADLTSAWDRAVPLVPAFVWPYEACYALPILLLFVIKDWHRFNVALLAIILANLAAFVVYVTHPIAFARPELGSSLAERVLAFEYAADFHPGANKLPSMHVAMAWIMICAMWKQAGAAVDLGLCLLAALFTVAPVFVKQHLLLDVVVGVPWGLAAFAIARARYRRFVGRGERADDALQRLLLPWRWARTP
jgi:hypothetical protein